MGKSTNKFSSYTLYIANFFVAMIIVTFVFVLFGGRAAAANVDQWGKPYNPYDPLGNVFDHTHCTTDVCKNASDEIDAGVYDVTGRTTDQDVDVCWMDHFRLGQLIGAKSHLIDTLIDSHKLDHDKGRMMQGMLYHETYRVKAKLETNIYHGNVAVCDRLRQKAENIIDVILHEDF